MYELIQIDSPTPLISINLKTDVLKVRIQIKLSFTFNKSEPKYCYSNWKSSISHECEHRSSMFWLPDPNRNSPKTQVGFDFLICTIGSQPNLRHLRRCHKSVLQLLNPLLQVTCGPSLTWAERARGCCCRSWTRLWVTRHCCAPSASPKHTS